MTIEHGISILGVVLNWPVLLFVLLIIVVWRFHDSIAGLFNSGEINLTWGDKTITLNRLNEGFDQEIDPLRTQIAELEFEVQQLRDRISELASQEAAQPVQAADPAALAERRALNVMFNALRSHKYRWRSLERLARIAHLSEGEARKILEMQPEMVFGKGKSGRDIVRFADS